MTKKRYQQLEQLIQGRDFSAMQIHFLTHFGEHPDLITQSCPPDPDTEALLQASLRAAVAYITGGDMSLRDLKILSLPQHQLSFGPFRWRGIDGSFFYCQAIGVGLVYLPDPSGRPGFARFRARILESFPGRLRDLA